MRNTIEFIIAGASVKRFHTVPTIQTDTVGHHSHSVALICLLLNPQASRELLTAALLHDLPEQEVGDIPSPAKRQFGLGEQLEAHEDSLLQAGFGYVPELNFAEKKILKLADIGSGALFCVQEIRMGNTNLKKVFWRYMSYAAEVGLNGKAIEFFGNLKEMVDEC